MTCRIFASVRCLPGFRKSKRIIRDSVTILVAWIDGHLRVDVGVDIVNRNTTRLWPDSDQTTGFHVVGTAGPGLIDFVHRNKDCARRHIGIEIGVVNS